MLIIFEVISFAPLLLALHCLFILLFKKWIGPMGTFYSSFFILTLVLFLNLNELICLLQNGNYWYLDFGRWFFCLDLIDSHLLFCIDNLALIASLLVVTLTTLALYFGVEYMFRESFINRLLYLLNLFATSVIFLFFCYDFFLIIIAWECIGLFSLLLVNFYSMRVYTIKAALKTFIFSRISDMFMFYAFVLGIVILNTSDLSLFFLQAPFLSFHYLFFNQTAFHFLTLFSLCIALSGVVKAAQFFFHVWLPDAMEAPTPASALIHSSTLVIAGIFLIIRFSILFEFSLFTNYYLSLCGGVTLAFGAITAIFQNDIKKLVAYSTVSQIGYLVCGCGFCCYEEVLLYLIIHALNKAFLFILVGYIVHFFNNNTDLRQMGGVYIYSFDITVLLFTISFNLAGLPYSAGFLGKEFLLFQTLRDDFLTTFVRACWLVSFFFTPIYMFILSFVAIFGVKRGTLTTYFYFWKNNYTLFFKILSNRVFKTNVKVLYDKFIFRFQYSLFTSRLTIYILIPFWIFFNFFGETLILLILNYSVLLDTVNSNFFFVLKSNSVFNLNLTNLSLSNTVLFYICFLLLCGFFFILSLKVVFNYLYFKNLYFLNSFFFLSTLCILHHLTFWNFVCLFFLLKIICNR